MGILLSSTSNGAKSMSDQALQYATQYGMFHWGPIAWAIYVLPALPIGYLVSLRRNPSIKLVKLVDQF